MKTGHFATAAALVLLLVVPARAQECAAPKVVAHVDLGSNWSGSKQYVPVKIAGATKPLLLDTGSEDTEITAAVVADLELPVATSTVATFSATGAASNTYITADVMIGPVKWNSVPIVVAPRGSISPSAEYVGLLGADLLSQFDLSLDLAAHTLELVDPNHCPGTVPEFSGRKAVAIPFKRLKNHVVLPVVLDGKTIMATLDTGATPSTLIRPVAEREFGLVMGGPDTPASAKTLNNMPGATVWHHTFNTLAIGDVVISNPKFSIIPDLMKLAMTDPPQEADAQTTASALPDEIYVMTDILIGMSVLKTMRFYIDYKDQKLYVAQ